MRDEADRLAADGAAEEAAALCEMADEVERGADDGGGG